MREFQLYLLNDRKLDRRNGCRTDRRAAFLLREGAAPTLPGVRSGLSETPERLPVVLSEEEVAKLIESASNAYHRVILMTLYGTGLRRERTCPG